MRRFIRSFGFAFSGLAYTLKTQLNFGIHLAALVLVILAGWYFRLSTGEWLAVTLVSGLVLVTELLNTAIELLVDLICPDFDLRAGRIKDVAAGAVLTAAIIAVVTALLIFIPKLILYAA